MRMRNIFTILTIGALTGAAFAQPAPPDEPPTPTPAPTPTPTPEPAPAPERLRPPDPAPTEPPKTTKPEDPPPTKKLVVGAKGLFNPGALLQGWYQLERAGGKTQVSQFRVRRAELSVNGEILPKHVSYKVMFDAARVLDTQTKVPLLDSTGMPVVDDKGKPVVINNAAKLSALQDFYITGLTPWVEVSIGQFKIPVSWEGYNSSAKLVFPERAVVSNTFGDKRDLGMRLTKTFPKWMYSGGIFNGSGLNNADTNVQKDLTLRLEAYPVKGLTLAGMAYDSVGERDHAGTKDRWEADVRYEDGPYLVQAEAILAQDVGKDGAPATKAHGFYALAGYTILDVDSTYHGALQPVVRIGAFDPDSNVDNNELVHFDIGLNYYLQKHEMKLQAAYQRTQFKDDTKPANNEVLVAAQVSF
jgi:hypothetical protein